MLLCALAPFACGCHSANGSLEQTANDSPRNLQAGALTKQADGASADEGHHAVDHDIPAHRPQNFVAALHDLAVYHTLLQQADTTPATSLEYTKLRDVVRWLPELAAETDLAEPDWNQVDQLSGDLLALLPPPPLTNREAYRAVSNQITAALDKLSGLAKLLDHEDNTLQPNASATESL